MVAIRLTRDEGDAVAGAQGLLAVIADQSQFAFENPNEFILVAMPMALTGPAAGRDHRQINAEASYALGAGYRLTDSLGARLVERGWVTTATPGGHGIYENSFQVTSENRACSVADRSPLYFLPLRARRQRK
jgi:hypothetical protein